MDSAIRIENLSKQYRLGLVETETLSHDLKRCSYLILGNEDSSGPGPAKCNRRIRRTWNFVYIIGKNIYRLFGKSVKIFTIFAFNR